MNKNNGLSESELAGTHNYELPEYEQQIGNFIEKIIDFIGKILEKKRK